MQSILIPVPCNKDFNAIKAFIAKLGIKAIIIDEDETRMKARKAITRFSKKTDITNQEIIDEIKAYRKQKNEGK